MSSPITIEAKSRTDLGKGASRRLRHNGSLPAIVYGGDSEPSSITLLHNQIWNSAAKDWFFTHILDLKIDDKVEKVVVKDMQRHPYKALITHIDFQRVVADQKLRINVPLVFVGEEECVGVKAGGVISRDLMEVEMFCLPADMPEGIEVDVSSLDIGDVIYLADLEFSSSIELLEIQRGNNPAIVSVAKVRIVAEDLEEDAEDAEDDEESEVEAEE